WLESEADAYPLPKDLQGEAMWRWQMENAESDAGQEWLAKQSRYEINVRPDGSFLVPEVLPGKYRIVLTLHEGPLGSGPSSTYAFYMRQIGCLWRKFEVPADSAAGSAPIDLGNLVLNPAP